MGALKTRTLGKSGMEVTEIGMGLWAAGRGISSVEDAVSVGRVRPIASTALRKTRRKLVDSSVDLDLPRTTIQ